MKKPTEQLKQYWTAAQVNPARAAKQRLPIAGQHEKGEFAPNAGTLEIRGEASRRKFMGLLGASTALAGISSTGCIRKPKERIMPFAKRPEDLIPGVSKYYATAYQLGGTVQGLLVESYDGRPIKIEGNKAHPDSLGGTDGFAQGSILNLYDPDRSQHPRSTFIAAVDTSGGSADERKNKAIELLGQEAYDRVLKKTRSLDAARKARTKYLELAQNGRVSNVKTGHGEGVEIRVQGEEAVKVGWDSAWSTFDEILGSIVASQGDKAAFLLPATMSPTYLLLIKRAQAQLPKAKFFFEDSHLNQRELAIQLFSGGKGVSRYHLEGAKVIFSADCDFLDLEDDSVRVGTEFSKGRVVKKPGDSMNRLYVAEAQLSVTGAAADHRLRTRSAKVADLLKGLVQELASTHGLSAPGGASAMMAGIAKVQLDKESETFVKALAKDLAQAKSQAVVMVGGRQPAGVHALGLLANAMLGSLGNNEKGLQRLRGREDRIVLPGLEALALGIERGQIEQLVCLDTNPVYNAPGTLGMNELAKKLKTLVHAGTYVDETAKLAVLHLPISHYLEAWGDQESSDGTRSICQPLIAPLYHTPSAIEVFARALRPGQGAKGYDLVRGTWTEKLGSLGKDDRDWKEWLNRGILAKKGESAAISSNWGQLPQLVQDLVPASDKGVEINFHLSPKLYAGEFANNGWMQECPHPLTKLTWDNAALISETTAKKFRVQNGDMVAIKIGDRSAMIPAWIAYGQADDTVSLALGYGRALGAVSEGAGFNVNPLRSHQAPAFEVGDASRGAGSYALASTQDYGLLDPDGPDGKGFANYPERPIYRETTVEGYVKHKDFAKEGDLIQVEKKLEPLWDRPKLTGKQQWGMAIDLNLCFGCTACIIACQAENNIPVVGKDEVANGREMHWIRLDRYYRGPLEDPQAVMMPMLCQQCESAPCENVCPVQATAHSPEGLNDMAYNRCVGTRYCANNCPYKVRRFNFFNYNSDIPKVMQLGKNPDVTIRFRGVIEKCSYCVQRINAAKIAAHVADEDVVKDGVIVPACQQVCPSQAITFGDVADPNSEVSRKKAQLRNYGVLTDLATFPRTTYLGRVRNPNPELS